MDAGRLAISFHSDLKEIEDDWRLLQENGLCTFYQTYEWCKAWQDTAGQARRVNPAIICGRDQDETLIFILPFTIIMEFGVRRLRWYGTSEITYGMGIYDRKYLLQHPGFLEQAWPEIIDTIGRIDSIRLDNQPGQWQGTANPLLFLFTSRGANQSYKMSLQSDYQALYEKKRSSSSRRSARKRDKNLLRVGSVTFELPETGADTYDVINTMINHQQDRLGKKGIRSVYDESRRAFLQQLAKATGRNGKPVLLPYHIRVDGKICAVMLGGSFQSTYWALISSLTPDETLYRFSPGDYTLRSTIEACCESGMSFFDFAAGDTAYKAHWLDETIVLFETNKVATLKGAILTAAASLGTTLKRGVKQTPWLFSLAQSARKILLEKKN